MQKLPNFLKIKLSKQKIIRCSPISSTFFSNIYSLWQMVTSFIWDVSLLTSKFGIKKDLKWFYEKSLRILKFF